MYATIFKFLKKYLKPNTVFKYGFNLSPMYRRSTGKINFVSEDLLKVAVEIPISYKNKNYVGTIFGGSMLSATDPIFMTQLINILGDEYVVWDKATSIRFKRPATKSIYVDFNFTEKEIEEIKEDVAQKKEIDLVKNIQLTDKTKAIVFAEVSKTIYIANETHYKNKRKKK